jgi:hypothetical protein
VGGSFQSDPGERHPRLRPLRVAMRAEEVFAEARNQVEDLPGWRLLEADEARGLLVCERRARLLGAPSRVTITVAGPDGLPSAEVCVRSETAGGVRAPDRRNVLEFMTPFHRRVC